MSLFKNYYPILVLLSHSRYHNLGVHGSKESINSSTKSSRRNSVILNQNVKQVQGNALSPSSQKQASANPSNAGTGKFNGQNAQGHLTSNSTGTSSAIWALKFNRDGRFLASGGQDCVLRIWCLVSESTDDNQSKRNSLSMGSNP